MHHSCLPAQGMATLCILALCLAQNCGSPKFDHRPATTPDSPTDPLRPLTNPCPALWLEAGRQAGKQAGRLCGYVETPLYMEQQTRMMPPRPNCTTIENPCFYEMTCPFPKPSELITPVLTPPRELTLSELTIAQGLPSKIKLHVDPLPKPTPQTEHKQRIYKVTEPPDPSTHEHQPSWPLIYTTHTTTSPPRWGGVSDPPAKAALPALHTCTTITLPNYTSYSIELQHRVYNATPLSPFPPSHMFQATPTGHGHVLALACLLPYCLSTFPFPKQNTPEINLPAQLPTSKMNAPQGQHHRLPPPSRPYTMLAPRPANNSSANHTDLNCPTDPKLQHIKTPHKPSSEHPLSWPSTDSLQEKEGGGPVMTKQHCTALQSTCLIPADCELMLLGWNWKTLTKTSPNLQKLANYISTSWLLHATRAPHSLDIMSPALGRCLYSNKKISLRTKGGDNALPTISKLKLENTTPQNHRPRTAGDAAQTH